MAGVREKGKLLWQHGHLTWSKTKTWAPAGLSLGSQGLLCCASFVLLLCRFNPGEESCPSSCVHCVFVGSSLLYPGMHSRPEPYSFPPSSRSPYFFFLPSVLLPSFPSSSFLLFPFLCLPIFPFPSLISSMSRHPFYHFCKRLISVMLLSLEANTVIVLDSSASVEIHLPFTRG